MKLSIVIPVYFNQRNLKPLYEDLKAVVLDKLTMDYEIVMVDDGSTDGSYDEILELKKTDPHIVALKLSKNFGSHAAILAGLSVCTGDCATMKAADLQEPSEIILTMLKKWENGAKSVLAVRDDREEPWTQKLFANTYYNVMRKWALPNMPKGGFDCFLIDRDVIDLLNRLEEKNTSLMGQILWCGFKTDMVHYVRKKREIGKSRWTLAKKVKLFIDSFLGFSYAPIRAIMTIGIFYFLAAIIYSAIIIIQKFTMGIPAAGFAATMIVMLFSFGIVMLSIGILGEYIWRSFDASRKRPVFIIEEKDE
ncbi:MAG: glycosyltransferase family 2 protein [Eubacteriales bacterium]